MLWRFVAFFGVQLLSPITGKIAELRYSRENSEFLCRLVKHMGFTLYRIYIIVVAVATVAAITTTTSSSSNNCISQICSFYCHFCQALFFFCTANMFNAFCIPQIVQGNVYKNEIRKQTKRHCVTHCFL